MEQSKYDEKNLKNALQGKCFTVSQGEVEEIDLYDLRDFVKSTSRPYGVGPVYYVTQTDVRDESGEWTPRWCTAKWATWGGPEVVIDTFDSEAEALDVLTDWYLYEVRNNNEFSVYFSREDAQHAADDYNQNA